MILISHQVKYTRLVTDIHLLGLIIINLNFIFQLVLYFMWAGIELGAAALMYFITNAVREPLEAFKAANSMEGATASPKDVKLEDMDNKWEGQLALQLQVYPARKNRDDHFSYLYLGF